MILDLSTRPVTGGTTNLICLTYYPATLLMYTVGTSLILGDRAADVVAMLRQEAIRRPDDALGPLSSILVASRVMSYLGSTRDASQHVFDTISPIIRDHLLVPNEAIRSAFEKFELLVALVTLDSRGDERLTALDLSPGIITNSGLLFGPEARPIEELDRAAMGGDHPWIVQGVFGRERFRAAVSDFKEFFTNYLQMGFFGRSNR